MQIIHQDTYKLCPCSFVAQFHNSTCHLADLYTPTGETLGEGSQGSVQTYKKMSSNKEYAVKIIEKNQHKSRNKVLKEIEIFHHCRGHENILQLIEYFEEEDRCVTVSCYFVYCSVNNAVY